MDAVVAEAGLVAAAAGSASQQRVEQVVTWVSAVAGHEHMLVEREAVVVEEAVTRSFEVAERAVLLYYRHSNSSHFPHLILWMAVLAVDIVDLKLGAGVVGMEVAGKRY